MKTRGKKTALILILALVLTGVAFGVSQALQPTVTPVTTTTLGPRSLARKLTVSGRLEAGSTFDSTLGSTQKVTKVNFQTGATVVAGDVLVELDTADLAYQLDKAVLNRDLLKVSLANARKQSAVNLDTAKVAYSQARKNYEDAQDKYRDDLVTRLVRDQADSARKTAQNQLKLAQLQYDSLQAKSSSSEYRQQLAAAELDIANLKRKIADSTIRSPIAGTVTQLDALAGQLPTQQTSQVQVVDLSRLVIKAYVNQYDAVQLQAGQPVSFLVKGLRETFSGSVTAIGDVAATAAGNSNEAKYEVSIAIGSSQTNSSAAGLLRPGYDIEATVTVQTAPAALAIDAADIQTLADEQFVYVILDGLAARRRVETGLETDDAVEITAGLMSGETYITHPPQDLAAGDRVQAG